MKKLIAIAIASALVAPSALAAEDELGMRYTSASEGFYASIRTEWTSRGDAGQFKTNEDKTGAIVDSTSRFGVQGSNDIGGGLEGFYRYEASVGNGDNSGTPLTTRLRYVGLRGTFGDIRFGTVWDDTYNIVMSKTDLSPNDSGRYAWYFRINNVAQYLTPDLNGFQAGFRVQANGDDKDNEFDKYSLVGQYSIAGFNVAGAYENIVDGLKGDSYDSRAFADIATGPTTADNLAAGIEGRVFAPDADTGLRAATVDDQTRWAVGASYAQDNWYVGGWYSEAAQNAVSRGLPTRETPAVTAVDAQNQTNPDTDLVKEKADAVAAKNAGDGGVLDNALETLSIGGNVTVDKVIVYAVYETQSNNINSKNRVADSSYYDTSGSNVGVIYNLGSQSRVWVEYVSQDDDNTAGVEDYINIGLRHNF